MSAYLTAEGFPSGLVRQRAREGAAAAFPPRADYGRTLLGSTRTESDDVLDNLRITPPVFMPRRLEKLIDLGREPMYSDVDTAVEIGGFSSPLPLYISALGSTDVASTTLAQALSRQAATLGLPLVIGENVVPSLGYGRVGEATERSLLNRIRAYVDAVPDGQGGLVIQQSTEDADAEVWNLLYSDPNVLPLLESGRLAFELKVGQGAKPGLGGMTVLSTDAAGVLADVFSTDPVFGAEAEEVMRSASPGTFTEEILRQQIRLMHNNFPRAKIWVKLHPGRDVAAAFEIAVRAGAHAVTVDGAEGGTGWAPHSFLDHVGLPLAECLYRIDGRQGCLLATGRIWEGSRALKCLALGARAVGLGRAAFLAVDEDPQRGLIRLVECLQLELKLLVSALGKYDTTQLDRQDLWSASYRETGTTEASLKLAHRA